MPFSNPNYSKLKTNLRLAINRLKLLEKKKTETALKARKEIAEYIQNDKVDRAKIRVEHIIREDYMVEAMEIVEMFCDLLLARFGLIQQIPTIDDGLKEAIASLIWVAPRMQADAMEIKIIADILSQKYGLEFAKAARENAIGCVNEKLIQKLSVKAPPKVLVEKYMIEIAKSNNLQYTPDPLIMKEEEIYDSEQQLIDFINTNTSNDMKKVPYPPENIINVPEIDKKNHDLNYPVLMPIPPSAPGEYPVQPPSYSEIDEHKNSVHFQNINDIANLPSVPTIDPKNSAKPSFPKEPDPPDVKNNYASDIDFDDLNRRFEELKKKR